MRLVAGHSVKIPRRTSQRFCNAVSCETQHVPLNTRRLRSAFHILQDEMNILIPYGNWHNIKGLL